MSKRMLILFVMGLIVGLVACSKDEFAYEYTIGTCTTGRQTYASLTDYCAGIQSTSRNNGCARAEREQAFRDRGCPGVFTATP